MCISRCVQSLAPAATASFDLVPFSAATSAGVSMPRAAAGTIGKASPFPQLLEELVVRGGETNNELSGQNTLPSNNESNSNKEEVANAVLWLSSAPLNVAAAVPLDVPVC